MKVEFNGQDIEKLILRYVTRTVNAPDEPGEWRVARSYLDIEVEWVPEEAVAKAPISEEPAAVPVPVNPPVEVGF